jgi:dTDP-4-dehydrorhamnose 3,5-epimerase
MTFTETKLKGSYIIEPTLLKDHRGFFFRSFCVDEFQEIGLDADILQVNRSGTLGKGSIRGLHYQKPPFGETKVVECIKGAIFDVIVDLRTGSETFMEWFGIELNEENRKKLFIPKGFAHGFQTLTEYAEINYFVSQKYHKDSEGGVRFDDPRIKIKWPLPFNQISDKDAIIPYIDENYKGMIL